MVLRSLLAMSFAAILFLFCAFAVNSGEQGVLLQEEFNDLNHWEPFHFRKEKKPSSYTIESNGDNKYLKAESNGSASAIIYKDAFNVYEFPNVRWSWRIENVYEKGNAKTKEGDDYPIRVYVLFEYNPEEAGFFEKATYNSLKLIYGKYPPHSSLNYVWANEDYGKEILSSPATDRSKMFFLEEGSSNTGEWITEEINILEDYKKAFGDNPPAHATIAIMNDSDNTGEQSVSYVDHIEVYHDRFSSLRK